MMFNPSIATGMNIFEKRTEQEVYQVRRSWKERLFTRPWKPLQKTKLWTDEEAVKRNKTAQRIGNNVYMTAAMIAELKHHTAKETP